MTKPFIRTYYMGAEVDGFKPIVGISGTSKDEPLAPREEIREGRRVLGKYDNAKLTGSWERRLREQRLKQGE